MSIAMQNQVNDLERRVQELEAFIENLPKNGSDSALEMRLHALEDKYKAMNARMGKKSLMETVWPTNT